MEASKGSPIRIEQAQHQCKLLTAELLQAGERLLCAEAGAASWQAYLQQTQQGGAGTPCTFVWTSGTIAYRFGGSVYHASSPHKALQVFVAWGAAAETAFLLSLPFASRHQGDRAPLAVQCNGPHSAQQAQQ